MVLNLTPADSPYTLEASLFSEIINLKPDVNIFLSGVGNIVINMPAVDALPNGQGQVQIRIEDIGTGLTLNCANATPDKFGSLEPAYWDKNQLIVPAPATSFIAVFTAAPKNIWNIT